MELPGVTIQAFPRGDAYWRIDWFGEVALPNRLLRRQQPSVLVYLSRVVADDFLSNPALLLQAGSTAPAMYQRKCWVSVGTMVLLRVGDIWRDQRPVFAPDYQLETFELDVDETSSVLVKAGLSRDDGFLLPLDHHPWHLQNTHAYCQAVALQDGRQIVIPCMELIRFYFGSSSSLLGRLFQPPLTWDRLIAESGFDRSRRHLHLTLAEGIPAASAADIGRIATSREAWWAALEVGTSCLQALSVGAPHGIHPKVSFPFEGSTAITAAGKWLPLGERMEATFVVFSLRQCQRPFRFKSLEYRHSGALRTWRPAAVAEAGKSAQGPSRRRAADALHQPLVERDAGHQLSPRQRSLRTAPRFTDLADKPIWGSRKEVPAGEQHSMAQGPAGAVRQGALGEPGSSERIRPVELAHEMTEEGRPNVPAFLAVAVEGLSAMSDVDVRLLTASEADGWTVPISLVTDLDGVIDQSLFVETGGAGRLRRLALFALKQAQYCGVVAVVEAEPFIAMNYADCSLDPPAAFLDLQARTAHDFVRCMASAQCTKDDGPSCFLRAHLALDAKAFLRWVGAWGRPIVG